jgi:hypothetical protein
MTSSSERTSAVCQGSKVLPVSFLEGIAPVWWRNRPYLRSDREASEFPPPLSIYPFRGATFAATTRSQGHQTAFSAGYSRAIMYLIAAAQNGTDMMESGFGFIFSQSLYSVLVHADRFPYIASKA